jgi:hypothetical protein
VALLQEKGGACVFLDPGDRLCAVHRDVGEDALPAACRQFPRVATLTPLGVSVTLSHYCPTAAATLFRGDVPLAVAETPRALSPGWPWEGLDAREALPPLLRPGVLMDWPSLERWEHFCVRALAEEGRGPEAALGVLGGAAEEARRWTPEDGPFGSFFERVLERRRGRLVPDRARADASTGARSSTPQGAPWLGRTGAWRLVAECVPHRAPLPTAPEGLDEADERWVAPTWPTLAAPVRRWLAARAFASWATLQGEGLRTAVASLRLALEVLRAEAGRGVSETGRPIDAELLKEAFRRADLLLVHLASPETLARRLSRVEGAGAASTG